MALIGTFIQQPNDYLDYDVEYSDADAPWLATGDALQSAVASVTPSGLTVNNPIVIGTKVKLWITGGTSGTTYKVTLKTTTTAGRVKEDELRFRIKDY